MGWSYGESPQRAYAFTLTGPVTQKSIRSILPSPVVETRRPCYFFVRPKRNFLELCVFLGREIKVPQVRRADRASKSKIVHTIRITHRDEVEAPITDWLRSLRLLGCGGNACH
jgi:hypothetical protein